MLVAAPLVGAQTAHAQYPPAPPSLTLSATTVTAGGTLDFRATGFAPQRRVTSSLDSDRIVLGRHQSDASGAAQATVTIPTRVRPGWHTFRLTARHPALTLTLSARIRVQAAVGQPGHDGHGGHGDDGHGDSAWYEPNRPERPAHGQDLAVTGGEKALAASGIAAALIVAGRGAMLAVRRRRSA
ncbi:hypothetical protein ABZZ20_02565 [Streptomyces sp. NPDC006430]|uniref:hypothetical protein n=1 Tax=Streptomyces sp. NPDC006430 TaxID=3154299 RepID=UPI0033A607AA